MESQRGGTSSLPHAPASQQPLLERWFAWVGGATLAAALQRLQGAAARDAAAGTASSASLTLDVPSALDLAAHDPELADGLLRHTDAFSAATAEVMVLQGLIDPKTRVWIRLGSAFVHHPSLEALQSAATAHGPHTASFTGVVHALSTVMHAVHSRSLQCCACKQMCQVVAGQEPSCEPGCFGGWEEVLGSRVLMAVQEVWLSDLSTSAPGPAPYHARPQSIQATLVDDLAGSPAVFLGATLSVVGHVTCSAPEDGGRIARGTHVLAAPRVRVSSLSPAHLHAPWLCAGHLLAMQQAEQQQQQQAAERTHTHQRSAAATQQLRAHQRAQQAQPLNMSSPPSRPTLRLPMPPSLPLAPPAPAPSPLPSLAHPLLRTPTWGGGSPLLVAHGHAPLQALANALMECMGAYVDPLLGLALLVSSAMAGVGTQQLQARAPAGAGGGLAGGAAGAAVEGGGGGSEEACRGGNDCWVAGVPGQADGAEDEDLEGLGIEPACDLGDLFAPAAPGGAPHAVTAQGPVGSRDSRAGAISLLVWHDPWDPTPARTLRGAAALLNPHSSAPGSMAGVGDLVMPRVERLGLRTDASTAEAPLVVTSSALTHANSGVLCLDGTLLLGSGMPGSRARAQQLQQALASACLVLDRRHPELQVPQQATVWAAAPAPPPASARPCPHVLPADAFTLVLRPRVDEGTAMACVLNAGCDAADSSQRGEVEAWRGTLQHHMALVARTALPALSTQAQDFLRAYALSVRSATSGVSMQGLLHALISVASGCARLLLRGTVRAHPDCTVAVLLLEQSTQLRAPPGSFTNLGLPHPGAELQDGTSPTLDASLSAAHAQARSQLDGFGLFDRRAARAQQQQGQQWGGSGLGSGLGGVDGPPPRFSVGKPSGGAGLEAACED